MMKSLSIPLAGAGLAVLLAVGAVSAASPTPSPASNPATNPAPPVVPAGGPGTSAAALDDILGLTHDQIMELRHEGLSLAQIAEQQNVDPQDLVDALVAQWTARIDARLAAGAITADQAEALKSQVATQAKAMVNQVTLGGMRGAAVGAGPNGARGMGAGNGMGAGRGGMMRGAGQGGGNCPYAAPAPSTD